MIRKLALSALGLAALGLVAFAPNTADAGFKLHVGHHFGHHWGYAPVYAGAPVIYGGYHSCWVKRWVQTPYGPRLMRVNVCY